MRRYIIVLAIFCLLPVASTYSQQDQLPQGGQPAGPPAGQPTGQPRQQFNTPGQPGQPTQGRPAAGAGTRPFATNPANPAQGAPEDPAYRQQVSYALGRNFAMNLKDNEIETDMNALLAGIGDVMRGAQPKWTDEQLETTLKRFEAEMRQKSMTRVQQLAAKNQQDAATFLAQNGKQPGVQTTPSGLQYRVLQQGNGPSPTTADKVKCNYKGTLLNGTEFDSSQRHGGPAEFGVGQVIPGWTEALQKMHVGDKWQLFVPSKLAYDMNPPRAPIEPGSMLVFEIELLEIAKK